MNTIIPRIPADAPHGSALRRAHHIYLTLGFACLILVVWGFARVAVCWGKYSWLGILACHAHWATMLGFLGAMTALVLLARDLGAPHIELIEGSSLRRARAAWRGYRSLDRRASRHVSASTTLLIIGLLAFAWLFLLSPVRF